MKLFGSIRKKKEQMVREAIHTPQNPEKRYRLYCTYPVEMGAL